MIPHLGIHLGDIKTYDHASIQNVKELLQLNNRRHVTHFENGRDSKQTFLQRRCTNGQLLHEKMLSVISRRQVHIQSTVSYHFIPTRKAIIKDRQSQLLAMMWEMGTLMHFWWGGRWCSLLGRQSDWASKY